MLRQGMVSLFFIIYAITILYIKSILQKHIKNNFAKTILFGFFGNYFISSNSTSVIIGSW